MDAIAALFLQEDKENIPPYPAAVAGGNCKPTTAAGAPPPKKFFRRIHRQRIPLADITNLFRGSDQMGEKRVVVGVERVSGKKRKSPEDGGSSGGDEVDTTSFGAVSRSLRFGFR